MAEGTDQPEAKRPVEAPEVELPPYVIEGARSSRARCKTCKRKIDKGALRIGVLIEGPYGTGYMWHHIKCAARRHLERVEEAYELQAWNEAKDPPSRVPDIEDLRKLHEEADERKKARKQIPYIECSPSGRSRCKHCDELIGDGTMRVVLGRAVEFGNQSRIGPINVHPRCVAGELVADDCATEKDSLPGELRTNSQGLSAEEVEKTLVEIGSF